MNVSTVAGIALFSTGVILLALSIPMLITHPEFLGYSYLKANNAEVNLLLTLMIIGVMIFPFGLIFISKGTTRKHRKAHHENNAND